MAQGITIKGKTAAGQNVEVRVDDAGRIFLNPESVPTSATSWLIKNTSPSNDPEIATYKYFGYVEDGGTNWRIMRKTLADNSYEYATGTSGYTAAWAGKDGLSYT